MNRIFQVRYFCFVSIHRKNKRYKLSKEYGQISATTRVLLIRNLWSRYNEHRRSPLEASFTKSVYAKRSKILSTDHQDSRVLVTCFSLGMFVKVPFTRYFFFLPYGTITLRATSNFHSVILHVPSIMFVKSNEQFNSTTLLVSWQTRTNLHQFRRRHSRIRERSYLDQAKERLVSSVFRTSAIATNILSGVSLVTGTQNFLSSQRKFPAVSLARS